MENLKVGRIVHYVAYGTPGGEFPKVCRAAVVTEVNDAPNPAELIGLCVLNPTGQFFNRNVPAHALERTPLEEYPELKGGSWHDPRSCAR